MFTAKSVLSDSEDIPPTLPDIACPHCRGSQFQVVECTSSTANKHYEESPGTTVRLKRMMSKKNAAVGIQPSPLKIGDTFESQIVPVVSFEHLLTILSEKTVHFRASGNADNASVASK